MDNDTRAMLAHHSTIGNFFHHDVSALTIPVLLNASLEDEFADMARLAETYAGLLSRMPQGNMHLFPTGGHPAVISNGRSFSELAAQFFR